ncbi:MAG: FAD:protein FMN transferase [bacterium]|nr:FAD:protein FMN transferase [bacterium]
MTDRRAPLRRLLSALVILTCLTTSCSLRVEPPVEREFSTMGTIARIELHDPGATQDLGTSARTAVAAVFDSVSVLMNTWSPDSEISRLNRAPADSEITLSPWLSRCLARAEQAYAISGGAFDPTAESLMRLWGFYRREGHLPIQSEIDAALAQMGHFSHDPATRLLTKGTSTTAFDLGGIAKGFAVDRAVAELRALGCDSALVDLGGNLFCLGSARGKTGWRVGIRDPENKEQFFAGVTISGRAVATSGSYERFVTIDGRQYGHIMNPATGRPATGLLSATVISSEAVLSDALSTALFVLGPVAALDLLATPVMQDIQAVLVLTPEGRGKTRVLATRSLTDNLTLLPQYRKRYTLEFF